MKRCKVHTVTEENYKWIFSKVTKFFEGREGFTSWHQFYGGMKKRVRTVHNNRKFPTFYHIGNLDRNFVPDSERVIHTYQYGFEVCSHEDEDHIPEDVLVVRMNDDEGFCIHPGDKVAFLGNRILIRTESAVNPYKYCYQMFQILKEKDFRKGPTSVW